MLPYFTRIKRYVIKPTCENVRLFRYFFNEKTVKMHSAVLVFILMAGILRLARRKLIIGSYFTNYSKTITHQAEIFQGKLSTIVIFIPRKLCVNLWTFLFFGLTNVGQGLNSIRRIWTRIQHSRVIDPFPKHASINLVVCQMSVHNMSWATNQIWYISQPL